MTAKGVGLIKNSVGKIFASIENGKFTCKVLKDGASTTLEEDVKNVALETNSEGKLVAKTETGNFEVEEGKGAEEGDWAAAGADELTDAFINGWTKESILSKVKELKTQGKSFPVTEYLDAKYITKHLNKFSNGVSCLKLKSNLVYPNIGFDDGLFVLPKSEMDALLAKTKGKISLIEKELGIPEGAWKNKLNVPNSSDELIRIDIEKPIDIRMSTGGERAADRDLWLPGGKTSGGYSEAVINSIPIEAESMYRKIEIITK